MNSWHRNKLFVGTTFRVRMMKGIKEMENEEMNVRYFFGIRFCWRCVFWLVHQTTVSGYSPSQLIYLDHLIYSPHAKGFWSFFFSPQPIPFRVCFSVRFPFPTFFCHLMNEKRVISILHAECVYGISSLFFLSCRNDITVSLFRISLKK